MQALSLNGLLTESQGLSCENSGVPGLCFHIYSSLGMSRDKFWVTSSFTKLQPLKRNLVQQTSRINPQNPGKDIKPLSEPNQEELQCLLSTFLADSTPDTESNVNSFAYFFFPEPHKGQIKII